MSRPKNCNSSSFLRTDLYGRDHLSQESTLLPSAPIGGVRASPITLENRSSASTNTTRRRVNVACGRCRRRKIRCSGDPGDSSGCNACKVAGVQQGTCVFLRVQCEARELVPEHPRSSAVVNYGVSHPSVYEPLHEDVHAYTSASPIPELGPISAYPPRTSSFVTQGERVQMEPAVFMAAAQSRPRNVLVRSTSQDHLGSSSNRQQLIRSSNLNNVQRKSFMYVPTSLELGDSPLSTSFCAGDTMVAPYHLRSFSHDASAVSVSSPYFNELGTQILSNSRNQGVSAPIVFLDQTAHGIELFPYTHICSGASSRGINATTIGIDANAQFPTMGSLSSSLPSSAGVGRPTYFQIATDRTLPALNASIPRTLSSEFSAKSAIAVGSSVQMGQMPPPGNLFEGAGPSSVYGQPLRNGSCNGNGNGVIHAYHASPDMPAMSGQKSPLGWHEADSPSLSASSHRQPHTIPLMRHSISNPSMSTKHGTRITDSRSSIPTTTASLILAPAGPTKEPFKAENPGLEFAPSASPDPSDDLQVKKPSDTPVSASYVDITKSIEHRDILDGGEQAVYSTPVGVHKSKR